ncbi:hypothetical protein ACFWJT_02545 [Streptomyces sp. NPDC127069]|uniref:hypothetical protein n=1 Tax=Streptomyces sp. NPDC127069 TaxID=3347128 RepID=UPI00365A594D
MASAAANRTSPSGIRRIVAASLVGTTIEWYDNSSGRRYDLRFSMMPMVEVSTDPAPDNRTLGL